jgi:hypothetical protein
MKEANGYFTTIGCQGTGNNLVFAPPPSISQFELTLNRRISTNEMSTKASVNMFIMSALPRETFMIVGDVKVSQK